MARGNGNGNGSARAAAIKLATQEKFLELYRECGLKIKSANGSGVCLTTILNWCKDDPSFEADVELARKTYCEILEAEVFRRGVTGTTKPVYYQGEKCGEVQEYSDRMLELHIKRHNPEYRERHQVDMNVTGGVLVVPGVVEDSAQWEKRTSGNG